MSDEAKTATFNCRAFNYDVNLDGTWTFRCEHCGQKRENISEAQPCPGRKTAR